MKIICKKHGIFEQSPTKHIHSKHGCQSCIGSKGEQVIYNFLTKNKIKFIEQMKFDGCKLINKLSFDFYLPDLNLCIEYDGKQHFEPIKRFGGDKEFLNIQKRDQAKNNYCADNFIQLIRIKYNDNLEQILSDTLF